MANCSNLSPFTNVGRKIFDEAIRKAALPQEPLLSVQKAASQALRIEEPTIQIGVRSIQVNQLSELLSVPTGISPETIKRILEDIDARHHTLKSNKNLLHALKTHSERPEEAAIATIAQAKELFHALALRRFISDKPGMVKNQTGKDVWPSKDSQGQFGDNWKKCRLNRWLEQNPPYKESFESFCKDFTCKSTTHFLTETLRNYIKLNAKQHPTLSRAAERTVHTYLTLHPEVVATLLKHSNILIEINSKFSSPTPTKPDHPFEFTEISHEELNAHITQFIQQTLLVNPTYSTEERSLIQDFLEEL